MACHAFHGKYEFAEAMMYIMLIFRMNQGKIFLLEINPRMSGGLQLSCLATGINLPAIALQQLLGKDLPWHYTNHEEQRVAHIETPICLQ